MKSGTESFYTHTIDPMTKFCTKCGRYDFNPGILVAPLCLALLRRKQMTRITAILAALGLSTSLALAGQAKWSETSTWTVVGHTDGWCKASTYYPHSGKMISLGLGRESGWSLFIGGVSAVPGDLYEVRMRATNGASGTIIGLGVSDSLVVFRNITPRTVVNLAEASGLYVQGLDGPFSLKGSMRAIRDTMDCYAAMTGEVS